MVAEPLKDKWVMGRDGEERCKVFEKKDVASAVEWFKEGIDNVLFRETTLLTEAQRQSIFDCINSAFEDVIVSRG